MSSQATLLCVFEQAAEAELREALAAEPLAAIEVLVIHATRPLAVVHHFIDSDHGFRDEHPQPQPHVASHIKSHRETMAFRCR